MQKCYWRLLGLVLSSPGCQILGDLWLPRVSNFAVLLLHQRNMTAAFQLERTWAVLEPTLMQSLWGTTSELSWYVEWKEPTEWTNSAVWKAMDLSCNFIHLLHFTQGIVLFRLIHATYYSNCMWLLQPALSLFSLPVVILYHCTVQRWHCHRRLWVMRAAVWGITLLKSVMDLRISSNRFISFRFLDWNFFFLSNHVFFSRLPCLGARRWIWSRWEAISVSLWSMSTRVEYHDFHDMTATQAEHSGTI